MTDEEKSEEYATEDLFDGYTKINYEKKQAYLDGLAEGRKESCEVCEKSSMKEYQKLFDKEYKIIEELEQKNAELKKENEEIINALEKTKCCQMCKYLEDNGSCLRADKDEVNKWGDFLIGTRRKNHCKYWELAE